MSLSPFEAETIRWMISTRNATWWSVVVTAAGALATLLAVTAAILIPWAIRRADERRERLRIARLYVYTIDVLEESLAQVDAVIRRLDSLYEGKLPQGQEFYAPGVCRETHIAAATISHLLTNDFYNKRFFFSLIASRALLERCENFAERIGVVSDASEITPAIKALAFEGSRSLFGRWESLELQFVPFASVRRLLRSDPLEGMRELVRELD